MNRIRSSKCAPNNLDLVSKRLVKQHVVPENVNKFNVAILTLCRGYLLNAGRPTRSPPPITQSLSEIVRPSFGILGVDIDRMGETG